jgi:hypothetical protein
MREVVNKLAGNHAARRSSLDALRRNVREQRTGAADAVHEMAAQRAVMSVDLHTGLAADLSGLRHEVQTTLGDFLAERHGMAADLKEQLDATREQREEQVAALRTEARQFVGNVAADRQVMADGLFDMLSGGQIELNANVRTLLGDFTTQRVAMSQAQDESLAANGAERRGLVAEMIAGIQTLLKNIAADNDAMATELRATLSSDRQAYSAATQALLENIAADQAVTAAELRATLSSDRQTRSAATADFIADANANRRSMAEALANRLDAFKGMLEAQVASSLNGFTAERADLHRSLAEMAQVWREFAAALHGNTVAAQPEPAPPAVKAPAEDVSDRLLAYLAQHAEGVKLVELEPEFGLSRPQLGKHLRNLVDSGKVVKDPETLVYKLA